MPAPGCWVTGSPRTSFRAPPEPPLRPTPGCSATASRRPAASAAGLRSATACWLPGPLRSLAGGAARGALAGLLRRSEEHTSELQSLMRISYAVFCLKKKKTTEIISTTFYQIYTYIYLHKIMYYLNHHNNSVNQF